jgi:uncharacterized protein YndB with AHSA1/START domain
MDRGTYLEYDGRPAVRFRRSYPYPLQRLWAAVTEPDDLKHWFPFRVSMRPRVGGSIEFSDDSGNPPTSGTILAYDPPRRLAYTWGGSELHFELEPTGADGCTLTLVNVLEASDEASRNAAGWSVCLAELDKLITGARAGGPHSDTAEDWASFYDAYRAEGMPSGAAIPGAAEQHDSQTS